MTAAGQNYCFQTAFAENCFRRGVVEEMVVKIRFYWPCSLTPASPVLYRKKRQNYAKSKSETVLIETKLLINNHERDVFAKIQDCYYRNRRHRTASAAAVAETAAGSAAVAVERNYCQDSVEQSHLGYPAVDFVARTVSAGQT